MSSKPIVGIARNQTTVPRTVPVFLAGLKRASELHGQRLLDVGCGDGTFTIPLGEEFEGVHGVDARQSQIRPQLASAGRLDFPPRHFDTIISIETLEHVDDLEAVAAECARVLKPGGQLVITVPNRWFPIEGFPWLHNRIASASWFRAPVAFILVAYI